jgi:hypothetical protein
MKRKHFFRVRVMPVSNQYRRSNPSRRCVVFITSTFILICSIASIVKQQTKVRHQLGLVYGKINKGYKVSSCIIHFWLLMKEGGQKDLVRCFERIWQCDTTKLYVKGYTLWYDCIGQAVHSCTRECECECECERYSIMILLLLEL